MSNTEPTDTLQDNIIGDMVDSLSTGIFAHVIVSLLFGKNISIKNIMKLDTLKEGAKYGAGVALFRRVGRPMLQKGMDASGMKDSFTL